jgi:transcriptional regulator with XRE-family HTH domain
MYTKMNSRAIFFQKRRECMKLSEFAEQNGLKYKFLAEKLGVTREYLYKIQSGERAPSLKLALQIEDWTEGQVTPRDFAIKKEPKS